MRSVDTLKTYRFAMAIGQAVWSACQNMDRDGYYTVGRQLIRSADSVAANISEGFGRHTFPERIRFCHIARGSVQESITWLEKAIDRDLLTEECGVELTDDFIRLRKMLNGYIRSLRRQIK